MLLLSDQIPLGEALLAIALRMMIDYKEVT